MKYSWNKPFQIIMKIKERYSYIYGLDTMIFEDWVRKLNVEAYNNFLEPLQVNQFKNLILIRYGLAEMQRGMWEEENSVYRQCRSLVIDLENEEIVASPFRKFFNLNEVSENNVDKLKSDIQNAKVFEISDKLDGSMQSCRYYNGEYMMFGSMALDESSSWRLQDGKSMLSENHKLMIRENDNLTFVFEYISVKDAHVVIYTEENEGLYLIGCIDVNTGYEYAYSEIKSMADKYNIKMTSIEDITFDEILQLSSTMKSNEKEGWVLNIDGHKVKVKCDDYVHLHRILDHVSSTNVIIQSIADDKFDDLISKIPESHKSKSIEVANKIFEYVKEFTDYIDSKYNECYDVDRKTFMLNVDSNVDKKYKGYVRAKYLGQEINALKTQNGSYKKAKEIFNE